MNFTFVAKTLKRRDGGYGDRSGLLKCDVRRFQHDSSIRQGADVVSQGAVSAAKHFVAGFELGYVFPNCFNRPGVVDP